MKKALENLIKAETETNKIDLLFDNDPYNESLEAAWMEAYNKEHAAFNALAREIVSTSLGMIDEKTAKRMITTKREQLENLIYKLA